MKIIVGIVSPKSPAKPAKQAVFRGWDMFAITVVKIWWGGT